MREAQEMHNTAHRHFRMIETTATSIEQLAWTVNKMLYHGIQFLQPALTRFEAVNDPGSMDNIAGNFCGTLTHVEDQLQKLGRLSIYKMCRYVDCVHVSLERCYGAVQAWNAKEPREFGQWQSIDLNGMDSARKLNRAYNRLSDLINNQLELLKLIKAEFTGMTDVRDSDTELVDLFERLTQAQFAVSLVQKEDGLTRDEAIERVKIQALREVIQRRVDAHRSSNVILIEHLESIMSLDLAEIVLEFSHYVQAQKEELESYMTTKQRSSEAGEGDSFMMP